jgi:Mn-dependent DtxR family transcriptional regulator
MKDGPCLKRLAAMGLAALRPEGRFEITEAGLARHASEVLKQSSSKHGSS